ncbi:MAG: carboxylesterase family protein [Bryobacterales bacterium]|nr:carboxylesterase family protein [Bryobacterales bacterium]
MLFTRRTRIIAAAAMLSTGLIAADRVKTASGVVEAGAPKSGIRVFQGIPFAAPPVGALRWKAPQPVAKWKGVKQATGFGPRCMQQSLFSDMIFRSNGMGEDCLYLNVWTPAKSKNEKLPVLVYFYGGGYVSGDGSESRYDGESMARKGIVALTVNYRLGVFGFLAHPELSKEAAYHGSGNYGLLDQAAALSWVKKNIAAFGGDPAKVVIAGESAGSISVSAQMASPLSRDLIAGAIGESGSLLGTLPAVKLEQAEQAGSKWAATMGDGSLAALRAMTAQQILDGAAKARARFSVTVDGYFFPESPDALYAAGKQAKVPLLAGWNSEEMSGRALLGAQPATKESYEKIVRKLYGDQAEDVLKAYSGATPDEVLQAATDLSGDRFIGFSTWKWIDVQAKTGQPVYRYYYARPRPPMVPVAGKPETSRPAPKGAVHSAEIEYAMGNLAGNKAFAWTADDQKVSQVMQEFFANFIKTRNPNGAGLPEWPALNAGGAPRVMRIDVETKAVPETHRERYLALDAIAAKAAK